MLKLSGGNKILDRKKKDFCASKLMLIATVFSSSIVFLIGFVLFQKGSLILTTQPINELFSSSWYPMRGQFGFYSFLAGTLWVTGLAMLLSIPVSLFCALYLAEYASKTVRAVLKPLVDLLAGIPSIIYGIWGVLVLVPLVRDYIAPLVNATTTGYSILAGGIVLAIMVFPIIISVSEEVLRSVPYEIREASLALGATKWQTVKHVVIQKGFPGLVAAIILGFSRAFGETMAVLMVVGNVARVPSSVFDPGYPLPALIANSYGEMMSIPLYDSALLLAAFILLLVVFFFNVIARAIIKKIEKGAR
jgi:phosphate transport system permease protein